MPTFEMVFGVGILEVATPTLKVPYEDADRAERWFAFVMDEAAETTTMMKLFPNPPMLKKRHLTVVHQIGSKSDGGGVEPSGSAAHLISDRSA